MDAGALRHEGGAHAPVFVVHHPQPVSVGLPRMHQRMGPLPDSSRSRRGGQRFRDRDPFRQPAPAWGPVGVFNMQRRVAVAI